MNTAGIKMIHVPYKGGGPSAQALLGGETMLSFVDVITALPFAKAGRLRPLAASTTRRSATSWRLCWMICSRNVALMVESRQTGPHGGDGAPAATIGRTRKQAAGGKS